MPYNSEKEQGVGYEKYSIGTIKYHTSGDNLVIEWGSIFKRLSTNTTIKSCKYDIYFSTKEEIVKKVSQCTS